MPTPARWIADHLDYRASLRLTLLILLLRPPGDGLLRGSAWMLAGLATVVPAATTSPVLWLCLTAVVGGRLVSGWPLQDNHIYLLAYWCLAVALALATADPSATLSRSARWLVAATFGCAVLWKAIFAADFLDGRFFRVTLVTDERFACAARVIGGLTPEQLAANREAIAPIDAGVELLDGPVLVEPPRLRGLAYALTWGGVMLELTIALAFASPATRLTGRLRHPALVLFILSTYAFAPVAGFGWLLAAMGLAATDDRHAPWRLAYLAGFAAVLVFAETPFTEWLLRCA